MGPRMFNDWRDLGLVCFVLGGVKTRFGPFKNRRVNLGSSKGYKS